MDLHDLVNAATGFAWDEGNDTKNWTKHAVSTSECEEVFLNNPRLGPAKLAPAEPRYFAFGRTHAGRALTVVFTFRGDRIRVISARPTHRSERR